MRKNTKKSAKSKGGKSQKPEDNNIETGQYQELNDLDQTMNPADQSVADLSIADFGRQQSSNGTNLHEFKDEMSNDYARTEKINAEDGLVDEADKIISQLTDVRKEENPEEVNDLGFKSELLSDDDEDDEGPLTQRQCELIKNFWKTLVEKHGNQEVGAYYFKQILEGQPEVLQNTPFKDEKPFLGGQKFLSSAYEFSKGFSKIVNKIDDPDALQIWIAEVARRHKSRDIKLHQYPAVKEVMMKVFVHFLDDQFTPEVEKAWAKTMDQIITPIMDSYKATENPGGITDQELKLMRQDWDRIERVYSLEKFGVAFFKNLYNQSPETLMMFSFQNEPNLLGSPVMKAHATKFMRSIGRVVSQYDKIDTIMTLMKRMGKAHAERGLVPEHYEVFQDSFLTTLENYFGQDFDQSRDGWAIFLKVLSGLMMDGHYVTDADGNATRVDESTRNLLGENDQLANEDEVARANRKKYLAKFRKEVDFHHKVAYRFEKAYRLGKKMKDRIALLNVEIIDVLTEHAGYIDTDPMALFYCLFFCIYYNNQELVEFLRTLIYKMPSHDKIDKLLEYIDVNGLERLRTVGETMNQIVYHMVFYQSVDDDLRIVYAQILRQLRFIQLRDKDALHFLYQRDYELIRLTFQKYTTKLNLTLFFPKSFPLKSSTYRKYNQAYYEEIVINNDVESRVTQNYRQRFLTSAEDINIVFEMYCKEDYDEQFLCTPKDTVSHKQMIELFAICLKNDSFRIAFLIYSCYMTPFDMDQRMMDILLSSVKESTLFHEHKLFYLHQHFDVLSNYQMNHLLDIYKDVLTCKDFKQNPAINQYNTIKMALLIYRICWKIEQKKIYSLITKCSLLKAYLIKSLSRYLERQSNILTLYKFMSEPILHMSERKDSLDIMYEMGMYDLLNHPVIVEVLNLIYEGKYSASSSALTMSQTFESLLDMPTMNLKSVNERLMMNIFNFGDQSEQKQTTLQYNIWKQSINQREQDEMLFTVAINISLILLTIGINFILTHQHAIVKEYFNSSFSEHTVKFIKATDETLQAFCPEEIDGFIQEYGLIRWFYVIIVFNSIGMLTSTIQKFMVYRVKDNVTLNWGLIFVEISIVIVGIIFTYLYNFTARNSLISDTCSRVMDIPPETADIVDRVYTIWNPRERLFNFKFIVSIVVIQSNIIIIVMFQRTRYLGELIMMLGQVKNELLKFFATFGLGIMLFLILGRILGIEIKPEHATYYEVFLDLFDAFNGNQNFMEFIKPAGQTYIAIFMYIFRVLLISLLSAMFVNRYKQVWQNLDGFRRFNIIKQKNSIAYDKFIGGVTLTFFPINIIMLPFSAFILMLRNNRASEILLKTQYVAMMILYCLISILMLIPASPILYVKLVANSVFILINNKREKYRGEGLVRVTTSIILGPLVIVLSTIVDLISLPNILLRDGRTFERKYQMSTDRLNDKQIDITMNVFRKMFYGSNFELYRNKHMTLLELMDMHRKIYDLVYNLHDLICKGTKDYKDSISNVQDYNMTKILSRKASIPDMTGQFKNQKVEMNVIYAIQNDIELFNYIDVAMRKLKMGRLHREIYEMSHQNPNDENQNTLMKPPAEKLDQGDDEDDETKKVDGIYPIIIGPDGVPLKRNNSDLMNNFFVDYAVKSFTEIESVIKELKDSGQETRTRRYKGEVIKRQSGWKDQTVGAFKDQTMLYEEYVKMDISKIKAEKTRASVQVSGGSKRSGNSNDYSKGSKNRIMKKATESTEKDSDQPIIQRGNTGEMDDAQSFDKGQSIKSN